MINYGKVGVVVGGLSLAGSAFLYFQARKIAKKVDLSVEELANKTSVDIEQAMIDKAVQQAVERETKESVSRATYSAIREVTNDLRSQVRTAVVNAAGPVEQAVSTEIARQVSAFDISNVRAEVIRQAKVTMTEKLGQSLDGVLEEYNRNLDNVSKIYGSIAKSMTKQNDKETLFKIV